MNWFGKKDGNGHRGQSRRQNAPEYAEISSIIIGRLSSKDEALVLIGIGDLMRGEAIGRKYRPSEVIDRLAEVLQFPHGEEVVEKAGDALIEKLGNGVHFDDAQLIITNRLGRRSEANAKLFVKMLEKLQRKPELKKLAVEMLAGFRGAALPPSTIESIEVALFERLMDVAENEGVKKAIRERFGKAGRGKPEIKIEETGKDETVILENGADRRRTSSAMATQQDIPTEGIDVISGLLALLRDSDPVQRERAAKSLRIIAEGSKSKELLERIREGAAPFRNEWPDLYRAVLKAIGNALREGIPSRPAIALGPEIGDGNNRKEPAKIKR